MKKYVIAFSLFFASSLCPLKINANALEGHKNNKAELKKEKYERKKAESKETKSENSTLHKEDNWIVKAAMYSVAFAPSTIIFFRALS